jgi:hypothetical protein
MLNNIKIVPRGTIFLRKGVFLYKKVEMLITFKNE